MSSAFDRSAEEIVMRIDSVIAVIEEEIIRYQNDLISAMQEQRKINPEERKKSTVMADHIHLLLKLYVSLHKNIDPGSGEVNVPRFVSGMLSHGLGKEFADGMIDTNSIDNEIAQILRNEAKSLATAAKSKDALSTPEVTKVLFYAHMVLAFSTGLRNGIEVHSIGSGDDGKCCSVDGFRSFLSLRPQLLWEDFPLQFYLPETWFSSDAKMMFVPPDLRPLPDYRHIAMY